MITERNRFEWMSKAEEALGHIAQRPWALFLLLLTVNTLAQPYAGITHDTRLYSVQVLNKVEEGTYADDIFFRYGSQDDYSLFSRMAAPLVRGLGLSAAFFLIYLVSKSLLIFGMMRIVQTLVPNRAAATLALIYCMAITLHFGGQHMLNVQESFVTPRMLASALVLIGLDLLLRARPVLSGLVMLLAVGIHPLMAFGGLLIWAGFHLWKYLGVKAFAGASIGVCALAAIVLAVEPLGKHCFGEMDDVWRQSILHASSFNFPSQWGNSDWYYLAFQLAILGVVIWKYRTLDADKARCLIVLMIVTLAGAMGAILAEQLPYALFLQGQAYRALWMLAFLHLAFVFWLCVEWSRPGTAPAEATPTSAALAPSWPTLFRQMMGCGLLAYLCCLNALVAEFALALLLLPLLAVALRGLEKVPHRPAWLIQSIQLSLVLGALGWAAYKFFLLIRGNGELLIKHPEYRDILEVYLINLGPIVFCAGACWLLVRITAHHWNRSVWYAATAAGCLGLQGFYFAFPETDFYLERCTHYRADLREVREMMHRDRAPTQPLPTVYCNLGCLDYVWLDLRSQSYFDWWQAGNFMYRREMALEGRRRARLVGSFEIAHYRKCENHMTEGYKAVIARFFEADFNRGPSSAEELARLCQEPDLDYLVLDEQVEGLHAVQVGRLYVYSCKEVRAALPASAVPLHERVAVRER